MSKLSKPQVEYLKEVMSSELSSLGKSGRGYLENVLRPAIFSSSETFFEEEIAPKMLIEMPELELKMKIISNLSIKATAKIEKKFENSSK